MLVQAFLYFCIVGSQATDENEALSDDFVEWMLAEPQPLVWIPTLYRLAASETGIDI